jgi:valyl-tRNA synthetase
VLDTWFSSALWPFATLGWPRRTPELERYYPGDVNSTAREIIRLWENRMIWAGLELMGDVPFRHVIIHSTILAADGRRMSKSLGTGLDPIDVIEKHGADATRYGLLKMSSTQDVRFAEGMIEEGRKLANKLWNVARLILTGAEGTEPALRPDTLEERWILARSTGRASSSRRRCRRSTT